MRRVLITRPRAQAAAFAAGLKAAGFEPISFPVIEIRPLEDPTELDQALSALAHYDWLIFTSVNGVEVVWERMERLSLPAIPNTLRVAAIGPKTGEALKQRGVTPAFIPDEYVAEAILPGLGDLRGQRVLLPRAEIARRALPEAIRAAGGVVHEIAVYRTLPETAKAEGLDALKAGVDVVTFTSPSTVQNFVKIIRLNGLDPMQLPGKPKIACIGPITREAAQAEGFSVAVVAKEYTTAGLVEALGSLENGQE